MSVSSGYWPPVENGNSTPTFGERDNVFYERVVNYNPVAKVKQVLEPLSPAAMSPGPGSPYQQTVMWTEPHQYVQEIQPPYSPGPTQTSTTRRYIVQNAEPEIQPPYSPGPTQTSTIRRYIVQNPEPEVSVPYQQGTIRRYIVQNPDQTQFLKGVNIVPGNNVIYEKTITRLDAPNSEQERQTIIRGMSTVSMNDVNEQQVQQQGNQEINQNVTQQVIQQINQRKISVQSSEQGSVFEQNIDRKGSIQSFDQKSDRDFGHDKMDSRYFGELLAELSRKNNDLYSCLLQHVEKIGGRRHMSSSSDSQAEDIESLIPKGASELTKQQIRYLLQMRQTSDKSMRLVLSTFNTLREDLGHLQGDLNKLENEKNLLDSDLAFKESQVKEYEALLASVRDNNNQQQQALKESALKIRRLEEQLLMLRNAEADKEYRLKELEFSKRALEQEGDNLRLQITETCSSPTIAIETEKISKHYMQMITTLREEKDKEIQKLRAQISSSHSDSLSKDGNSRELQMKIIELTSSLQRTELLVKKQQEELFRLRQERESKGGVTKAIITKKYRNQYPILGLLSDYNATSPIKDTQTIVIERTGEMWKQSAEHIPGPRWGAPDILSMGKENSWTGNTSVTTATE